MTWLIVWAVGAFLASVLGAYVVGVDDDIELGDIVVVVVLWPVLLVFGLPIALAYDRGLKKRISSRKSLKDKMKHALDRHEK